MKFAGRKTTIPKKIPFYDKNSKIQVTATFTAESASKLEKSNPFSKLCSYKKVNTRTMESKTKTLREHQKSRQGKRVIQILKLKWRDTFINSPYNGIDTKRKQNHSQSNTSERHPVTQPDVKAKSSNHSEYWSDEDFSDDGKFKVESDKWNWQYDLSQMKYLQNLKQNQVQKV